jgi:hypothetical protein
LAIYKKPPVQPIPIFAGRKVVAFSLSLSVKVLKFKKFTFYVIPFASTTQNMYTVNYF